MIDADDWWIFLLLGGVLFLVLVGFVFGSCQESRTYNRLTGANTTTWDAMWVELRVQGVPK